ncbi:MAG TPA: hypothetical protein VHU40_15370, partial [Polyangia bacterium]|nr:hypothetical protein [Polyangia bacterium]
GARIDAIPAGQTDFAPTLLGLLGIDAAPLPYMVRNVLNAPGDPPVLRQEDFSHLAAADPLQDRVAAQLLTYGDHVGFLSEVSRQEIAPVKEVR